MDFIAKYRHERGISAVIVSMMIVVLVGFVGLAVDAGNLVLTKIRLQDCADTAALSAIRDVDHRDALVSSIVANSHLAPDELSVVLGDWDKESNTFTGPSEGGNAVRVELGENVPLSFIRVLPGVPDNILVHAGATAKLKKVGAIVQLGATLLSVDAEQGLLLNAVLGGLLGTSLNLDVLGWEGLANASLNLVDFIDLAQLDLGLLSADDVLDADLSLVQMLDLMIQVLEADGNTAAVELYALRNQIVDANIPGIGLGLRLGDLIQLDTNHGALARADVNLLSLVTTGLQLFNHDSAVMADVGVDLGGLLDVDLKLKVVESPVIKVMYVGDSIHSAGLKLYLHASLLDIGLQGLLGGGLLNVPLYLEGGEGDAVLTGMTDEDIDLDVSVSALDVYLGTMDEDIFFTDGIYSGSFDTARILNLLLLSVSAQAYASATGVDPAASVTLTPGETQSVGAELGTAVGGLLSSLTDPENLTLNLELGYIPILPVGDILAAILSPLSSKVLSPLLTALLNPVTALTGIQPGRTDVTFLDFAYEAVIVD